MYQKISGSRSKIWSVTAKTKNSQKTLTDPVIAAAKEQLKNYPKKLADANK